jgi:phosphoribosylglycinamide formyltransferase-1
MKKLAVFASGNGSNAENLIRFFAKDESAVVKLVVTNNPNAGVIIRAKKLGIPVFIFENSFFQNGEKLAAWLLNNQIQFVILAGFLKLIPNKLIQAFPQSIINLHPSLLPKFGGKGMFGNFVHKAVLESGETESGITIHLVDEEYDKGKVLARFPIDLAGIFTPEDLAQAIHELESAYFPEVVKKFVQGKL